MEEISKGVLTMELVLQYWCFNNENLADNFKTIDDAKKKANEDYKNRLKSALKL